MKEFGGDEPVTEDVFVEVTDKNDRSNSCNCIILGSLSSNPVLFMAVTDVMLDIVMELIKEYKLQYYIDKAPGMMNYIYTSINDYMTLSHITAIKGISESLLLGNEISKTKVFVDNKMDF